MDEQHKNDALVPKGRNARERAGKSRAAFARRATGNNEVLPDPSGNRAQRRLAKKRGQSNG